MELKERPLKDVPLKELLGRILQHYDRIEGSLNDIRKEQMRDLEWELDIYPIIGDILKAKQELYLTGKYPKLMQKDIIAKFRDLLNKYGNEEGAKQVLLTCIKVMEGK